MKEEFVGPVRSRVSQGQVRWTVANATLSVPTTIPGVYPEAVPKGGCLYPLAPLCQGRRKRGGESYSLANLELLTPLRQGGERRWRTLPTAS